MPVDRQPVAWLLTCTNVEGHLLLCVATENNPTSYGLECVVHEYGAKSALRGAGVAGVLCFRATAVGYWVGGLAAIELWRGARS